MSLESILKSWWEWQPSLPHSCPPENFQLCTKNGILCTILHTTVFLEFTMQESTAFQSVLVYQKVTLIVYHLNNGSLSVNLRLWGEPQSSTQSATVVHTVTAIPKSFIYLSHFFVSNHNSNISTPWNSSDSVQKAVDLTTPAKNRRKMSIKYLNFQIKKFMDLACRLVWNWPSKSTTQCLDFCEM